jgi:AbrB family looped-hinge helix DNA binding protein
MKPAGTYKITRQGQITLPAEARESLNLKEGDVVDMFYGEDIVLIKKKKEPLQILEELATAASKRFAERKITKENVASEIATVRKGR